jgi:hypothetical protein
MYLSLYSYLVSLLSLLPLPGDRDHARRLGCSVRVGIWVNKKTKGSVDESAQHYQPDKLVQSTTDRTVDHPPPTHPSNQREVKGRVEDLADPQVEGRAEGGVGVGGGDDVLSSTTPPTCCETDPPAPCPSGHTIRCDRV